MSEQIYEITLNAVKNIHNPANAGHLHALLGRYLPVSQLTDQQLAEEFSEGTVHFLSIDETPAVACNVIYDEDEEDDLMECGNIESYDLDGLQYHESTGVSVQYADRLDPLTEALGESITVREELDEYEGMSLHEILVQVHGFGESKKNDRKSRAKAEFQPTTVLDAVETFEDEESLLTDVVGGIANARYTFTIPVRHLTNEGFVKKRDEWSTPLAHDKLFIAPVTAGFNRRGRRYGWFGRHFKSLRRSAPTSDFRRVPLGTFLSLLRQAVSGSIGEQALSKSAIRPLARTVVRLGESDNHADVWPVTEFVSLAVALPDDSRSGERVAKFRNWSQRKLGTSERTGIAISRDILRIMVNEGDKSSESRSTRRSDWIMRGAPEPQVNLTDQLTNKIQDLIIRKTFEEEITLIVLESSI